MHNPNFCVIEGYTAYLFNQKKLTFLFAYASRSNFKLRHKQIPSYNLQTRSFGQKKKSYVLFPTLTLEQYYWVTYLLKILFEVQIIELYVNTNNMDILVMFLWNEMKK